MRAEPATFWGLVARAATERPDAIVVADDHGRALTTTAFMAAAEGVAAGLWARGIGGDDVVSWQLPTVLEAPLLLAACARLGVRQNPIIPQLRAREVTFIVEQVGARLLVVPESWHGFVHGEMARSLDVEALVLDLEGEPGSEQRLPWDDAAVLPPTPDAATSCRWLCYSSGATAEPKGPP